NIVWFAREAGPTHVTINALAALSSQAGSDVTLAAPTELEPGQPLRLPLIVAGGDRAGDVRVTFEIQRDPRLGAFATPHPDHGSDRALNRPSWTEHDGKQ